MRGAPILTAGLVLALPLAGTARGGKPAPEQEEFQKTLKTVAPAAGSSDGDASGRLGTRRMRKANRVAAEILEKRMRRRRPNDLRLIREAGAADVVVVRGGYDRVQDVLRAVRVKHVVIPPRLLARIPLMSTQTVMINCPGRVGAAGIAAIRRFVKTGGHLVTTDWALTVLQRAFPGYVKRGGRNTGNDVVKVHVHDGSDPLLAHVKAAQDNPRWWLESSSYPIRVLDRKRVKVLISSKEMRRKYGHAPIAVAFRYDDGKVMHMTSHFYLQQAKLLSRRERAAGASFAKKAGLSDREVESLKGKGLDGVKAGELNSAYSMQQVTANVVAGKQRANRGLLKKYKRRAKRDIVLKRSLKGKGKGKGKGRGRKVRKDYRLRQLDKVGNQVKVRDLFGNEGWVDEDALQ